MMIHKISTVVDYNKWLKRWDTKLKFNKCPKVVEPTNKKTKIKNLGTSVTKSPMSTPSL